MPTLAPKRILTVEDNAIVSADVRSILEAAGYDVVPDARDGVQAVEHVRAYTPDLVLLDLTLPRLDGVSAARLIREETDVPIVGLTGSSDQETLEHATAVGTSGLVRKPFSAHGLLAAVRSRLAPHEDDFGLRCLVEEMVSQGASEREIVRALRARSGSDESLTRAHGRRRSLWQMLPFVKQRGQGRAAA